MLDYKKNRLDYGKLLNPPDGFVMTRAVATTYSLDLTAFLSIPVALFYNKNLDGKVSEDRMDIFDAIQKTSDSITIYCQKGKIKLPETVNRLFSFLEDSVIEVLPDDAFKSFHPKLWIVKYRNLENKLLYRVIVLSRNLTFDRSWDIAFCLEGYVSKAINENAVPIADYVKHLTKFGDFQDSALFIDELRRADFNLSTPFNGFEFHPMGFENYTNPLITDKWQDLIIVSPFLDKITLKELKETVSGKRYLFSRKEELDKIHLDVLDDYIVYAFSQSIIDGEDDEDLQEEAEEEPLKQNLHAKIFIGNDQRGKMKWYLGSANCSNPAMHRNEEFLVGLKSIDAALTVNNVLNVLLTKDKGYQIFDTYVRENKVPIETDEFDFRLNIYTLLSFVSEKDSIIATCTESKTEQTKYDISLVIKPNVIFKSTQLEYSFAPYGWKGDLRVIDGSPNFLFDGMAIHHLSPFIVWRIRHIEKDEEKVFITRIAIRLPDERKQAIFKSIIQDKERFIQLIQFLLGANDGAELFTDKKKKTTKIGNTERSGWFTDVNMYEELLLSASRDKNKLQEIDKLLERLKSIGAEDLIPAEFNKVWDVFKQVLNNG